MTLSFRVAGVLLLAAALAAPLAAAAPFTPPPMRFSGRPHPAVPANLPPPHLIGNAATRLLRPYGGTPIDVLTYHYDLNRTGWNPTETDLTPASVASSSFGLITTLPVDGNVLAQPLLVRGITQTKDNTAHDVLVIVTGHDSVYAFDAETDALLWQVSLGTSQSSTDVGCGDVLPEYGISSTPVIVRVGTNRAQLIVVAATEPTPRTFVTQLHVLNLANGAEWVPPVTIAPSAVLSDGTTVVKFDPQNQWSRAGLAYNNGSVYIGIGSHCDNNADGITGWLLRYNRSGQPLSSFHTVQSPGGLMLSSIWMSGFAPAINASGDVFVVTGNGNFTHFQHDWGESVLQLNPTLGAVKAAFTPISYASLTSGDIDFGSGGVMLLPTVTGQTAPPMAVAMGKAGTLYLMAQNRLGGLTQNDSGVLQSQSGGSGGLWGGPAYFNGPNGPMVFTQTGGDFLRGWAVNAGSTPSLTNTIVGTTSHGGYGGSLPIVSSNGSASGTGLVWLIDRYHTPFTLQAYDADSLGAPIVTFPIGTWSNTTDNNPFLTPMEANGRVYAPGYLAVQVYGLLP